MVEAGEGWTFAFCEDLRPSPEDRYAAILDY
jgi:hypothetical protein